jgi:hypothetical protein
VGDGIQRQIDFEFSGKERKLPHSAAIFHFFETSTFFSLWWNKEAELEIFVIEST